MKIQISVKNLKNYKIYLQVEKAAHEFLQKKGYLKIDLPVLSPALIPESYLEIFETEFRYFNKRQKIYLTPSPELFLKRLLAYGAGNCYYLGKSFRNSEPSSNLHLPEFTMLEYYKTNAKYMDIVCELLEMLQFVAVETSRRDVSTKNYEIIYQGKKISLEKWEKMTVTEAFSKFAGIERKELFNHKKFIQKAKIKGYQIENSSYVDLFSQIYAQEIEPNLGVSGAPTIIYDYPKEMAALAKLNPDGLTAQRFEFYIAGIELGDGYTELTDWKEQKRRFLKEEKERKKTKRINHKIDWQFIEVLKKGLPECAGIAIGFDRLAMIFADCQDIKNLRLINI